MHLLTLYVVVKAKALVDYIYTVFYYYRRSLRYALADMMLVLSYLWRSPYRIHKNYLIQRGEKEIYTYGETPLATMKEIAEACSLTSADLFVEMGAGRGRGVLWTNVAYGCRARGIEIVPFFALNAKRICALLNIRDVIFEHGDMLASDMSDATVVYLYSLCLDSVTLSSLVEQFSALPVGARVITVDEPVCAPYLTVVKKFSASYPWGDAELFLHLKKA